MSTKDYLQVENESWEDTAWFPVSEIDLHFL
jgi:hypothetical protein